MQNKILINGIEIYQPDSGLKNSFATTYTSDSTRVQSGIGHFTPMFTVEQFNYTASHISTADASIILQQIITGQPFTLHYFSVYYNRWRDDEFYVGQGDFQIGTLIENDEYLDSLSFNMTGVNPL